MKVVGYTYDADMYCPSCTQEYIYAMSPQPLTPFEVQDILNGDAEFEDSEGNPVHPVFDTNEAGDSPDHCSKCGTFIDTSWHSETMDYAIDSLRGYVEGSMRDTPGRAGDPEVLDEWNENLQWCMGMSDTDELIRTLYKTVREHEVGDDD